MVSINYSVNFQDLEKYDGTRRRSSALEAQGFPS